MKPILTLSLNELQLAWMQRAARLLRIYVEKLMRCVSFLNFFERQAVCKVIAAIIRRICLENMTRNPILLKSP